MNYNEILETLETKRKLIMKRIRNGLIVGVLLIVVNLLANQFLPEMFSFIIILTILGLIIYVAVAFDAANKYRKLFKNSLMPLLIEKVGANIKYDFKAGVSQSQCMDGKLFKKPDRFKSEDLLYGSFEEVSFYASDVNMEERRVTRDSKGRTRVTYVSFFSGRWFVYDFNKTFNGIIQVREDGLFEGKLWGLQMSKIELEDVSFNKKFKTYATNQHDAFYVLTPSLMENIKTLENRYPGRIYISFIGTKLHIAMNGVKNSFEPPIWSPITDAFIEEQIKDISLIQEIIHELRLNRKIFK